MDSSAWDQRYAGAPSLWSMGPNVFVESRLADKSPGTGVDLACGEGRNAIWLAERGWDMTGVDFSPVAMQRARERSHAVEWVVADVTTWEPSKTLDLVLIAYLHLPPGDVAAIAGRARRWLGPGGELFMVGHDRSNLTEGHGGPQDPQILWRVDEMADELNGLVIVEAGVLDREVLLEGGEAAIAKDALIRAAVPA